MKLIVGLGNPGEKYDGTRHNLGFRVVEELAYSVERIGSSSKTNNWEYKDKFKAEILQINYTLNANLYTLLLVKPLTYMNNSGLAVRTLAAYYKLPATDIIVVHDELDLPLGKIKVRIGGSAAGHHGVESIIESLGDDKFTRVRLGIGNLHTQRSERDRQHVDVEHFVLEPFSADEKAKVKHMLKQAAEALEILLEKGEEAAQNQFN